MPIKSPLAAIFPLADRAFWQGTVFRCVERSGVPAAGWLSTEQFAPHKVAAFPPKTGDGVGFAALSDGRITTITAGMDMRRRYHRIPPQRQRFNIGLNQLLNLRRIVAAACS